MKTTGLGVGIGFKVTYRGVTMTRVGVSWYADVGGRAQWIGASLAEAKRWVARVST